MCIGKPTAIWRSISRHFKAARGEIIIWLTLTRCRREYVNEVTRNPLSAIEDLRVQDWSGPSPRKSAKRAGNSAVMVFASCPSSYRKQGCSRRSRDLVARTFVGNCCYYGDRLNSTPVAPIWALAGVATITLPVRA
jgi:hypothetical protein